MDMNEKFQYNTLADVKDKADSLDITLPLAEDISVLGRTLTSGHTIFTNRLAIQPMEGCDGNADGSPGELTMRRYDRFSRSGAGLIWAEATAVVPGGRANPRQLMLTKSNLDKFKQLVENIRRTAQQVNRIQPVLVLQLTHSGRYSKPNGTPVPLIARNNPLFEKDVPLSADCIVTDDYLSGLPEQYARTAKLAGEAGFDGVDIKACHGYLMNELLSAYTRPGRYGGDFYNRIRLFSETIDAVKAETTALAISRLSVYDGFPRPYGWGADENGLPDMSEPFRLVELLRGKKDVKLLNITAGNPYVNPHVNRPYDNGPYVPPEHPLTGLAHISSLTSKIKHSFPALTVVGSGYSYLRQFSPCLAAGMIASGGADIAGFGRMAFAYPDFARDILNSGLKAEKCCITCGKCSELMRAGSMAGCVIRDKDVYLPIYNCDAKGSDSI